MKSTAHPARKPVAGWLIWALGWMACAILVLAVVALITGPIQHWTEELAPPATGGISDNVISAAISGGLLLGLGTAAFYITRIVRVIGLRLRTWRAEQTLARDRRPPVLYLRSFGDDEPVLSTSESFEQSLASVLRDVGPVIAVGRPGERLPPLGGARLYLSDESWQPAVRDLMTRSALTVLRAGVSPGVLWELARVVECVPPARFLIAAPAEMRAHDATMWKGFRDFASQVMPHPLPANLDGAIFLSFDADWKASIVPLPKKHNPLFARTGVRDLLRPFCEQNGFKLRKHSVSEASTQTLLAVALAIQAATLSRMPSDLRWRELSASEGFAISMPGKHYEKRATTDVLPGIQAQSHEYGVLKRDRSMEFSVSITNYTSVDFTNNLSGAFDGARNNMVAHLKGTLLKETPIRIDTYPGREWRIGVPARKMVVRSRMYVVGPRRTFLLLVAMPANGSEDQAGRQFLDSFRLR